MMMSVENPMSQQLRADVRHREWAALLLITAAAVTRGELSQTEREILDDWILSKR